MMLNMQRKSFVKIWEWICKQILKYPNILKSWDKNWSELTTFFEYPQEIRKIIYTTNAVESYHRMVRKFTKSKAIFPTDDSIRKIIFMSVKEISKKWTMPVRDWGLAYSQLAIFFEDRFAAWRLMRVPPSNSRGLSALGISGEDEEKQQHFCHCSSPFYSAACVGSLLSVALFGCIFSMVRILVIIAFTRFDFQNQFFDWVRFFNCVNVERRHNRSGIKS